MKIELPSGRSAWLIGDPHLGKKFEVGVPLARRGERERLQMAQFLSELETPDVDYNIMVGDLFDHPHVSYGVAVAAAEAYIFAAARHPKRIFVAMPGNHDLPRNVEVVGAWNAFCSIIGERHHNLVFIDRACQLDEIAFFPWEWSVSSLDQVKEAPLQDASTAIGHWDLKSYGGDDSHLAPVAELHALGITEIYGGHYHTAGDYQVGPGVVHCTGSMQPYSHAEDPEGDIYVTLTLDQVHDGRDLSGKCVRVLLEAAEEAPFDLDCMALTVKRVNGPSEEVIPISFGDFDWKTIMTDALKPLTSEVREFISDRMTTG